MNKQGQSLHSQPKNQLCIPIPPLSPPKQIHTATLSPPSSLIHFYDIILQFVQESPGKCFFKYLSRYFKYYDVFFLFLVFSEYKQRLQSLFYRIIKEIIRKKN